MDIELMKLVIANAPNYLGALIAIYVLGRILKLEIKRAENAEKRWQECVDKLTEGKN